MADFRGEVIGIEGPFGSGKTAYAVYLVKHLLKKKKRIRIFSNIKMSNGLAAVTYCEPFDMFAVAAEIIKTRRAEDAENRKLRKDGLHDYDRGGYTKNFVILDEAALSQNNRSSQEFDLEIVEFINQCRKFNTTIILVSADGNQVEKNFRRFVKKWIELAKIPWIGWLFPFDLLRVVYWSYKDLDGNVIWKEKITPQGSIKIPQRFFEKVVLISSSWRWYDDLQYNFTEGFGKRLDTYWETGKDPGPTKRGVVSKKTKKEEEEQKQRPAQRIFRSSVSSRA